MRLSLFFAAVIVALATVVPASGAAGTTDWQSQHDRLVTRLRALSSVENRWGPAWQPLYHAALPWYERFGGSTRHDVDDWMSPPEKYAEQLADALEQGRNFFAENPGALIPLAFSATLPGGRKVEANYWITLPSGFPAAGRTFPLIIGLHGSGWLGHKISFVGPSGKDHSSDLSFTVTPIDEAGPWQIDFLNAFLDEVQRAFPIDADRVYLGGHSLGAMATWEWALENPERFAAISPRAGRGEPFRAARLRNLAAWVIHGANDEVVSTGFSDQMVTALEACGGRVRYSVLRDVAHNMPEDLDEAQITAWYLRQTRSREPIPADPREHLGLGAAGFSPTETITLASANCWKSESAPVPDLNALYRAVQPLFRAVHAAGERADAPLLEQLNPKTNTACFWLATPASLRRGAVAEASTTPLPGGRYLRFYFRGKTEDALKHLTQVAADAKAKGQPVRDDVWITPLTLWPDTPNYIAEYRVQLD